MKFNRTGPIHHIKKEGVYYCRFFFGGGTPKSKSDSFFSLSEKSERDLLASEKMVGESLTGLMVTDSVYKQLCGCMLAGSQTVTS